MSIEAMKQVIEKLKVGMNDARENESHFESWMILNEAICDSIDVLRQAIEQAQKQEPVAWRFQSAVGGWAYGKEPPIGLKYAVEPLYTSPPQRPAAEGEDIKKPLTDKQIGAILDDPNIAEKHQGNWLILPYAYARAIEAAHGITGEKE